MSVFKDKSLFPASFIAYRSFLTGIVIARDIPNAIKIARTIETALTINYRIFCNNIYRSHVIVMISRSRTNVRSTLGINNTFNIA
jgi:hypothetical protein